MTRKKHINEIFRNMIRSNAAITLQFVRQTKKDVKLCKTEEVEGMAKKIADYVQNVQMSQDKTQKSFLLLKSLSRLRNI